MGIYDVFENFEEKMIYGFENEVGYIGYSFTTAYSHFVLGSVSPPILDGLFFPKN